MTTMHTLLQATIVAVSLAAPAYKPAATQLVMVNLGVTRVLLAAPKPVAVVMPTMEATTR